MSRRPIWQSLWNWFTSNISSASRPTIKADDPIWLDTVRRFPFLRQNLATDDERLRQLVSDFLRSKEFAGANELTVTDDMAVAIAAQACLPLLHIAGVTLKGASDALRWYGDFVTIVVHPGDMVARRTALDAAGVVHAYQESLRGEAMENGPVTLSWQSVLLAGQDGHSAVNLVIHEFAHKLDMHNGTANGCPAMPLDDQRLWMPVMTEAFAQFKEQVIRADRFGEPAPWLDGYAATSPPEFFAVCCEAYFVDNARFTLEHPTVGRLFDRFFKSNRTLT